ncbi:hypothetical protein Q4E93_22650 [Flavitalea sp. BT771]|uniref:hypothetical protein n=1 Tax=Flavitalea sp. BT771 TaxID=3063329 RepID=UPI0026E164DF|nr:hypothetical protein [Flavitalea sp. BT771]MDO6433430.1 hypothetical protein [Flavitalea sp. BT771]MDV6222665.1 hypothetical protein [Flavitalea sp. BT771]
MFLVVCLSALLAGSASGQNFLPEKAKLIPVRQDGGEESFLFRVIPAWEVSGRGKAGWGIVLPERGQGNEGMGRRMVGADARWTGGSTLGAMTGFREGQAGSGVRGGRGLTNREGTNGYNGGVGYNNGVIPADRVVTHFGFFCKRELELEKTIRLPLRFRLGSLEYCNRLEGK